MTAIPSIARRRTLVVSKVPPVSVEHCGENRWKCDFGLAFFGTIRATIRAEESGTTEVCLGEKLTDAGDIDRSPPGMVRCRSISVEVQAGTHSYQVAIPPDRRNTGRNAIRMPADLFEVLPFRYAEISIPGGTLVDVVMLAVHYPFDDAASDFESSDVRLNRVWGLCKHTIKATTFCGIYVDGDRERIPYEADAYINQLGHYGVDCEYELARHTFEHLLFHPTWPTEWALHFVPMAWADYVYTGRTDLLARYYDELRTKLLLPLAREDGLISTITGLMTPELIASLHLDRPMADIVDWPPGSHTQGGTGERDGHEMLPINTVVNAFHFWNLDLFGRIAAVLNRPDDAACFARRAGRVAGAIRSKLCDSDSGLFVDGEGATHSSQHANFFPAAFGLAWPDVAQGLLAFLRSRGMACSVYGAQYLLEALYRLGDAGHALDLMTAEHDRGWLHMLDLGSTMTLEAWDWRYKNNLDWNHAWGAAPANIIPRFLAGVRPAEPGFAKALVAPQPAGLRYVKATVPTCRGPVRLGIERHADSHGRIVVESPVSAQLCLAGVVPVNASLKLNDRTIPLHAADAPIPLPEGRHEVTWTALPGR